MEIKNIANKIASLLNANSKDCRFGLLTEEELKPLSTFALQQLNYGFKKLTELKSICFCYPEPPLIYPSSEEQAKLEWEKGATLSFQSLEKKSIFFQTLCTEVSSSLGFETTCSMYIAKPDGLTFSKHYDEWIGIAIQLKGIKEFEIYSIDNVPTSYNLKQGNWLRLDPVDIHLAKAKEFSIHLNFALHKKYEKR